MKTTIAITLIFFTLSAGAQQFISSARAIVDVTKQKKKTKLTKEKIIMDKDTLFLSDNTIIINSNEEIVIKAEIVSENDEVKVWEGIDVDLPVKVYFFKKQDPATIFVNYHEFGVMFFIH
jgi:hypothetical protein